MSSRRFPTAELYEERQRDFYRNGHRSDRSYDELDLELRTGGDPRRSAPDFFLREEHSNPRHSGQLVVRGGRDEAPPRRREVEEDTLVIRGGRGEPRLREREFDELSIRRGERDRPRPREVEREEIDIKVRHRDQSRPRRPESVREVDREEITFRRGDGARPRPREVDFEREEVRFRRDGRGQSREREVEKDTIVIRGRERSLPPPRSSRGELVAREREEFVVRRRPSPSPSPPPPPQRREEIKEELIIRRVEQRSPTPPPPPPPPPEPEPIVRPPIIQEVITHHRHIDHGVERARSPTPPPPPPSPPRDERLEISIRRRENGAKTFDEDFIFEREERKSRDFEVGRARGRSLSAPRRSFTAPVDSDFESEADYYNRKAMERAYPGEAWNGATKRWEIVDVPPGTNRVRMDGAGGGAQEITWQRYNGVRRSKFISGDDEHSSDYGMPAPAPVKSKPKEKDMWTEITKDLVIKDAIEQMGYDYEETDFFYYVMEYLRYEDVLQLVELSDEIRRKRRSRIRQIEYEREEIRRPSFDDRYYHEHDITIDRRRRY